MEYQVIFDDEILSLEKRVNEMLNTGWECQGGIHVLHTTYKDRKGYNESATYLYQAIIRNDVES